jgi:hypothetical protein
MHLVLWHRGCNPWSSLRNAATRSGALPVVRCTFGLRCRIAASQRIEQIQIAVVHHRPELICSNANVMCSAAASSCPYFCAAVSGNNSSSIADATTRDRDVVIKDTARLPHAFRH